MLRGSLEGKNLGDSIRLFFMQRGNSDENRNVPVKIYKRIAPDINFDNDLCGMAFDKWYEYIDNQSHLDPRVKLIFEGTLPLAHSYNEYIDTDVEVGSIYIYWVEGGTPEEYTRLGPCAVKVRSRDVWWPNEKTVQEMHRLAADYPDMVQVKTYGETSMHRPIMGFTVGNQEKVVALAGVIHASEPGPELLLKAVRHMLEWDSQLLKETGLAVLPTVNIDVRERTVDGVPYYLRLNHNGVDLNRNFSHNWSEQYVYGISNAVYGSTTYHGPFADSENETLAAKNFVDSCKPIALFVYDGGSVVTEDKMLYSGKFEGPLYDYSNKIATLYSKAFRVDYEGCGTHTAPPISYPFRSQSFTVTGEPTGTFDGWANEKYNIPAYSMQHAASEEIKIAKNDDTTPELLNQWARRHAHSLIAVMQEFNK